MGDVLERRKEDRCISHEEASVGCNVIRVWVQVTPQNALRVGVN
jgi:hypothetical protein